MKMCYNRIVGSSHGLDADKTSHDRGDIGDSPAPAEKAQIVGHEIAGEEAEKFVLQYEQNRLSEDKKEKIRIISHIDVTAGYDIVSFDSDKSIEIDRFIEVKAIGQKGDFFWSENEYEVAKLKGKQYYLYLVNLVKASKGNYKPKMICDPANTIMNSQQWLIETKTYHITPVPD